MQVLALSAMRRPMSFLTLSGAIAHVDVRSAVGVGRLMAAGAVSIGVKVSAVGAFLLVVELIDRCLHV